MLSEEMIRPTFIVCDQNLYQIIAHWQKI